MAEGAAVPAHAQRKKSLTPIAITDLFMLFRITNRHRIMDTKTQPWELESNMEITCNGDGWRIRVGGGQMPEYTIDGDTLPEAITRLVHAVTEDAIKDEALEWSNFA